MPQAEVADQPLGGLEAANVADRGDQCCRGRDVDAGDRHQPLDLDAGQRVLGEVLVDPGELTVEEVDLAQARRERVAFVDRQLELGEPSAAALAEQVAGRRATLEVSHEDAGYLVLDAGALTHQLRAPRREAPQDAGALVADPDARDQIDGQQLGECARVEAVVFDLGVADRANLHRVGDDDLGDVRLEDPRDRQRVASRFQHDAIGGHQAAGEQLQCLRRRVDPTG